MTREETIKKMIDIVIEAINDGNYSLIDKAFDLADDYNRYNCFEDEISIEEGACHIFIEDEVFCKSRMKIEY